MVSIGTFLSVSLLSHLTQFAATSTSEESCSWKESRSLVQDDFTMKLGNNINGVETSFPRNAFHLSHILLGVVHPGSILILTDCITEFISEDFHLLSSFSIAITFNVSRAVMEPDRNFIWRLFPSERSKPFVVMTHLPEEVCQRAMEQIYDLYEVPTSSLSLNKWQPTVLIIGGMNSPCRHEQVQAMKRTFGDIRLQLDSMAYMIFPESYEDEPDSPTQGNATTERKLKLTVWEAYSLKATMKLTMMSEILVPISRNSEANSENFRQVSLESYGRRRRNLHLENFSASVKYDPYFTDWLLLEKGGENETLRIAGGYVSFVYRDLQMLMNFTEKIVLGDSPTVFQNGTAVGKTAKQLRSGQADLSLNQISFNVHRAKAFTFLQPTYYSLTHAFFKQPSQNSIRDIVVGTFTKELWITLIGAWVILVLATKVNMLLSSWRNPISRETSASKDFRFSQESVLWSLAALCQKSWYLDPFSISLRLKVWIGSVASLTLYIAYSAAIVSDLAANSVPVESFQDLIWFKFVFTVHEQSETFQNLLGGMIDWYNLDQEVTTTSTEKEISHLYINDKNEMSPSMKSSRRAFLSPADMFYKTAEASNYSSRFICDHISSVQAGSYMTKSGMLVRKGSEFKEILNYMLIYLRARGLIYRNIESYNVMNFLKCIPMDQRDSTVDPAELSDVFTVLLVLFVGVPLTGIILVLEVAYALWKESHNRIRDQHQEADTTQTVTVVYLDELISTYYLK